MVFGGGSKKTNREIVNMALDRNGKVINNYTYKIAKMAVSEGRDELVFAYHGLEYYICVANIAILKKFYGKKSIYQEFDNPFEPYWCCYTENGDVLTIASKENIMDEIRINGKSLEDIWSQIIML